MKYVAYYRVSTKVQGESGLGLDAQKKAVEDFLDEGDRIIAEYTEVESGRKEDRQQLKEAIQVSIDNGATLVIAKLDRLSRNASFTMALMDSKVRFVAVDMPDANTLTIGIMALLAQTEAERISDNTRRGLDAIKKNIKDNGYHISKQGNKITSLGNPENLTQEGRDKSIEVRKKRARDNKNNRNAIALIRAYRGMTLEFITKKLNDGGFVTSRGGKFTPIQVSRVIELYKTLEE